MKLGIATIAWTSQFDNSRFDLIDKAAALGVDAIEIPFGDVDHLDLIALRERLQARGVEPVAGVVLWGEQNPIADDVSQRRATVDYMLRCVEAAQTIGATLVTGVIHSPVGYKPAHRPTERHLEWSAEAIRAMAERADALGVRLGLEPVNRYENPLINTAEQGLDLIARVDRPNIGLHIDTFHGGIEEKSWRAAIAAAGDKLVYLHVSENDRGIPGTGLVDWDEIFAALHEYHFGGIAALECFADVHEEMQADAAVWRPLAPSPDALVHGGVAFLREQAERYGFVRPVSATTI